MKLLLCFFVFSVLNVSGGNTFSQNANFKLAVNGKTVKQVFKEIESQSQYRFLYNDDFSGLDRMVSLNIMENDCIDNVLTELLIDANLTYRELENDLIVITPFETYAQELTVSGRVVDEQGNPLPGATIIVQGTTIGTVTDVNGEYTLVVPDTDAILTFSFVGYVSREILVGRQNVINVSLETALTVLDEIVAIGYGTQRRSDLTGSVSQVSGDVIAKQAVTRDPIEILQGKVAGLDITMSNNRPGESSSAIIRGFNSITAGNEPLIVLDGAPYEGRLTDINSSDIATIDVLKDASSTAIYGSRGANGVIIITTKRGVMEDRMTVSYQGYGGFYKIFERYDLMSGREWADMKNTYLAHQTLEEIFTPRELQLYHDDGGIDWQERVFAGTGYQTDNNFSIGFGGTNYSNQISLGYHHNQSIIQHMAFKRYTGRLTGDVRLSESVDVGYNLLFTSSTRDTGTDHIFSLATTVIPLGWDYLEDGSPAYYVSDYGAQHLSTHPRYSEYPYVEAQQFRDNIFASMYLNWKISDNITFRTSLTPNRLSQDSGQYLDPMSSPMDRTTSSMSQTRTKSNSLTFTNVLTFTNDFGNGHNINFQLMHDQQSYTSNSLGMNGEDVPYYGRWYNVSQAPERYSRSSGYSNWAMLSFMGRLNYNYQNRYLFTLTGRQDGSSRLADGNEWDFFPSGAFAWRIDQEDFMTGAQTISNLKLRVSYGVTGNTAIDPYTTLGMLGRRTYVFGDSPIASIGFIPTEIANRQLGWERTEEFNVGFDFGIFRNRINTNVDLYERNTKDLLMNRMLPVTSGFTSTWQNIGQVRNRGIELGLNSIPVQTQDWFWDLRMTLAFNQNEIIDLYGDKQDDVGNQWFIGHPIHVEFLYTWDGVWQIGEEEEADRYGRVPGQSKVVDVNDDGIYGNEDRNIYNSIPRYIGGLSSELSYRNWDLNMYMYARLGYERRLGVLTSQQGAGSSRFNHLRVDYWTPDNPTNEYPRPTADADPLRVQSNASMRNLSFIRLKNINIGYTFPTEISQRIRMSHLRGYVMIDNPFVWTYDDLPALDPENALNYSNHPPITSFNVGLNIIF